MFSEDLKLKPLLLCLMLLSGSALAQRRPVPQPSAEQVAAKALPAVALVVCDNGQKGSQASGFFVKPGILVTNYHVIHNMDRGAVQMVVGPKKTRRQFRIVEVVNFDEESDLALLSVPEAKKATVPLLTLAPAVPNVGAAVFALGNPEGLVGTISPGIVSAPPRLTGRKFRLQITAPVSEGSSGGPVVNSRAEVVGIVQGSITEGQNLNFAVPASLISNLLKETKLPDAPEDDLASVVKQPGKVDGAWLWPIAADSTEDGGKRRESPKRTAGGIGPVRAGEDADDATLRRLEGVNVLVEGLSPAGRRLFNEDQLRALVERRLRENRIRVLADAELEETAGMPYIYLNLNVLQLESGEYVWSCELKLEQDARLERDLKFRVSTPTWHRSKLGFTAVRVAEDLFGVVEGLVDEFSRAFHSAQ